MIVTYRDKMGLVEVFVDGYNVGFVNGYAFFSSVNRDYKINVNDIVCISKEE